MLRRAARRDGGAQPTYRQLSALTGWAHGVIGDYFAGKTLPPTDRFDTLVQLLGATGRELRQLATARDRVEEARRARTAPAPHGRAGPPGTDDPGALVPVPRQLPADIPEPPLQNPGVVRARRAAPWAAGERSRRGRSRRPRRRRQVDTGSARGPTLLTERRMLIVLDNALDAAQVRPLLPAGHGCAVLVTSLGVLATLSGAVHLHLSPLTPPASIEVLDLWAGPGRLSAERGAAETIAHHCGHLPLALRIAGARLAARPRWPVRELADRLADPAGRLAELSFADLDMHTALDAGHRELLARGPTGRAAALALPLLAAVQGELTVTEAAATNGAAVSATEVILEQLVDVQLLESRAPGRYRFHPLTRLLALRSAARNTVVARAAPRSGAQRAD
ncbi:hypothetical protein J8N05_24280 [Streptomyces sp. BH-SS-21]|uniref:HTH cro/C1-type domain-containing protein n=1 Tax=Streptomyces liliiviolaceus TaxID=2823109 RepID=A0A940Y661_9ACTN|nr:hypothetical protein [Streptomyces liliiviolaceus]MBQ0851289.1 hypothetical protein [Streptomyces liliiviolaceus]